MSQHADFSPSGSEKRYLCPASYAVERDLPDEDSAYSSAGTDRHELQAACLRTGKDADYYLGKRTENGAEITDDMTDAVQWCVDKIRVYAQGGTMFVEQRVNYSSHVGIDEHEGWGTPDVSIIAAGGEELIIVDSKHGYLDVFASTEEGVQAYLESEAEEEVEVKGNRQCMDYALGALTEYALFGDFKRIRLVILQPAKQRVSEWDCTIDELMQFAKEEAYAIEQCKNAQAIHEADGLKPTSSYFNPVIKACRFCRFSGQCGALANHVKQLAYRAGNEEPVDPAALSDMELGAAIDSADLVGVWLRAIRAEGERRAFAGMPPRGAAGPYKLVQGRKGNRRWQDEQSAEVQLRAMRLKRDQMYNSKLKTPPQLEKVLKENPRQWKKLQPLITQNEGGISLAPASDKRPAYVPENPADDFEDISGEKNVSSQAA